MRQRVWLLLLLTVVTIWAAVAVLPDKRLHVIFCNVGQGDATLLVWGRVQILVDGGPDDRVMGCLERHIPFFDRRIELVLLTHPQEDHLAGLASVVKRYNVMHFVGGAGAGKGKIYTDLVRQLAEKNIEVLPFVAGDKIRWESRGKELEFKVIWPTEKFESVTDESVDVNLLSRVARITFGEFEVLLAGDADAQVQAEQLATEGFDKVEVLKVPHHGSKTGLLDDWLLSLKPELAVISVGKNSFGHPAEETMAKLHGAGADVRRTDRDGEVQVISDGMFWWLE